MAKTKYYYNEETCQYKRVRWSVWKIFLYGIGLIITGGFLFSGLVFLTDQIIVTDQERSLKAENTALASHQIVLTSQLEEIESSLLTLHEIDESLHTKLFEERPLKNTPETAKQLDKAILSADEDHFEDALKKIEDFSSNLYQKSAQVNNLFGNHFKISANDATVLQAVPTIQPLAHKSTNILVSGFGMRINPFHKGKYMHQGIDFAATRGTSVLASADGTIKLISETSLKAGYGNYLEIDHGNGFVTRYAHLDAIKVKHAQRIKKGTVIGTVGSSGGSIAPHLHYEILQDGKAVDPLIYMVEGLNSKQYNQIISINQKQNQSLD